MPAMREWFEMHWTLRKTADERKEALQRWDDPQFQSSMDQGRMANVPINETKFWLENLMRERGEIK